MIYVNILLMTLFVSPFDIFNYVTDNSSAKLNLDPWLLSLVASGVRCGTSKAKQNQQKRVAL